MVFLTEAARFLVLVAVPSLVCFVVGAAVGTLSKTWSWWYLSAQLAVFGCYCAYNGGGVGRELPPLVAFGINAFMGCLMAGFLVSSYFDAWFLLRLCLIAAATGYFALRRARGHH